MGIEHLFAIVVSSDTFYHPVKFVTYLPEHLVYNHIQAESYLISKCVTFQIELWMVLSFHYMYYHWYFSLEDDTERKRKLALCTIIIYIYIMLLNYIIQIIIWIVRTENGTFPLTYRGTYITSFLRIATKGFLSSFQPSYASCHCRHCFTLLQTILS